MAILGCGFASQTQEITHAGIPAGPAAPANGILAGTRFLQNSANDATMSYNE
jgi:hypothetical protein